MSNPKKKKQKPVQSALAEKPAKTASQLKKERKAEAERQKQERLKKRQRYYGVAAVVAFLAVALSFGSSSTYGTPVYFWLQIACFLLMGVCGVITMMAAKFEDVEKKRTRMHTMGLVFVTIALGMCIAQVVQMFNMGK